MAGSRINEMSLDVKDTTFDLDSVLPKLGYSQSDIKAIKAPEVLMLPADLNAAESRFVDRAVTLKKSIEAKVKVTVVTKQGSASSYYATRSAEIIIPTLVFIGWQALDISKGMIAAWIYDQMMRFRSSKSKPDAKLKWVVIDAKR